MKNRICSSIAFPISFSFLSATFLGVALSLSTPTHAFSLENENNGVQTVIAPKCLLENGKSTIPYKKIARVDNLMLIQARTDDLALLRIQNHNKGCGYFLDRSVQWKNRTAAVNLNALQAESVTIGEQILLENINKTKEKEKENVKKKEKISSKTNVISPLADLKISYETQVNSLLKSFNPQNMWQDLAFLSAFPERSPNSDNGIKAANWFKDQIESLAKAAHRQDITVRFVETQGDETEFRQPSVVVTIPGTDPTAEGVLVGGHFDTLKESFGNMPGADDDGSGSVTVLETARVIINSDMRFKRNMYFVWYSAEEQGLIGSQYVVKDFSDKKIPLRGVLQLDMTGYQAKKENKIWIMDDFVDANLTKFVSALATNYAKVEVAHTTCGYACSDHASWWYSDNNYPAAMPFEAKMNDDNPHIHTSTDTMEFVSLDHMKRFAIVSIAFMAELAEPVITL